jgi:hypothetical protein
VSWICWHIAQQLNAHESLPLGVHAPRNPMIYSALPRIIRLMRRVIDQEPTYSQQGNELALTLPRKVE